MANKRRILVIDDEFEIRQMLQDFLGLKGYEVVTANDGREGLDHFLNSTFDAAIIDIKMPVMDGIECASEIKKNKPDFPILLMTGHMGNYSKESIEKSGFNDLVLKPLDIYAIEKILLTYF